MTALQRCFSIEDLRQAAKRRLPHGIFEYIDRGTEDGVALANNRRRSSACGSTPGTWSTSANDMSTEIFGAPVALPIAIAPTAVAGLMWHQGELALAKAAAATGIPFTLATGSLTPMETIATAGGRLWFQLYMWDEVEHSYDLVRRAKSLGFETLVVTIDSALGRLRAQREERLHVPFKPNRRALVD